MQVKGFSRGFRRFQLYLHQSEEGDIKLKESHQYYYQNKIMNAEYYDFVVWNKECLMLTFSKTYEMIRESSWLFHCHLSKPYKITLTGSSYSLNLMQMLLTI